MKKIFTFNLFVLLMLFSIMNLSAADHIIEINGLEFTPSELTISVGDTVLWINNSGTHNVNGSQNTYPDNPEGFFSGAPANNWEFEHIFNIPGTYDYRCDPHVGAGMVGVIHVVEDTIHEAEWIDPPGPITLNCEEGEGYTVSELFYSNNETGSNEISGSVPGELSGTFDVCGGELIAEWSFTDQFDRTITHTQVITIEPASEANWINPPPEIIISCEDTTSFVLVDLDYSNNKDSLCAISGSVAGELNSPMNECGKLYTATWIFTDVCGRTISHVQDITVESAPSPYMQVTIPELRENDSDGIPLLIDELVEVSGVVYGTNLRPQGLQFTIIDEDNVGVAVFNASGNLDYTVEEGDLITIRGVLTQFNGLAQVDPDEIDLISEDNDLVDPRIVSEFNESTESALIKLEDVTILNPGDWPAPGTAANIEVQNQHGTFLMRIHREVNLGTSAPTGSFDLVGLGGQFTTNIPADDGYQILPRYADDLGIEPGDEYTVVTMPELRENDANGVPVLLGESVEVTALVYGINYRPQGLQFTLIDDNNVGVGVFRGSGNLDYDFAEGDRITLRGVVAEFRGLTQINAEEIEFIEAGQPLVEPRVVDQLDESTESSLIKLEGVTITNPGEWPAEGDQGNVTLEKDGQTYILRVQRESRLGAMAPSGLLNVTGIGSQFTTNVPANDGYQIIPRYEEDIELISGLVTLDGNPKFEIWPVPSRGELNLQSEEKIIEVIVYDLQGRLISRNSIDSNIGLINLQGQAPGVYVLQVKTEKGLGSVRVILH